MKNPSINLPSLSDLELEVMKVVWDLGDCSSAQVVEAYQVKRALAPTTIRTVLTKLKEKGYVKQIPSMQRGFMFRPTILREKMAKRSLKDCLDSWFNGAPKQAIAYLLDEDLPPEELAEIKAMLEKHDEQKRTCEGHDCFLS
ncbi:MAG: BlaI family penicillinase repressor [Verrucomicrobiales bacterium]|jgi:BlaI family penicillinase repressor